MDILDTHEIIEGFDISKIGDALKPSSMMKGFLSVEPLKTVIQRFGFLSQGVIEIFEGIGLTFVDGGKGVKYTFTGLGALIDYTAEYTATNIKCSVKLLKNFTDCFWYYALEILGKLIYFFLVKIWFIIAWICSGFNNAIWEAEKGLWNFLESVDRKVIDYAGFHIIHYPKDIRDKCYNCRRLKQSVLPYKADEYKNTMNGPIKDLYLSGPKKMGQGGKKMLRAFTG
jgi:hypothetical protein